MKERDKNPPKKKKKKSEEKIGSLPKKEFRIMIASELKSLSRVQLLVTPWTVAHQTSSSMGFSRQEYWSGVPLPSPIYSYSYLII